MTVFFKEKKVMGIDFKKKRAGIMVPVFALRHEQDLGIGDTTAVREAIDFCALNSVRSLRPRYSPPR